MAKLQNIKALREMLKGEHKFQTKTVMGYEKKKEHVIRKVGDIWEETDNKGNVHIWEQKQGYRVKASKSALAVRDLKQELNTYPNCYEDCQKKSNKKNYTRHDEKTRAIHGMCLDCLAKKETELKVSGKFDQYQRERDFEFIKSYLKDVESQLQEIKEQFSSASFTEEDGSIEKWGVENKNQLYEQLDQEFAMYKEKTLEPYKDLLENVE